MAARRPALSSGPSCDSCRNVELVVRHSRASGDGEVPVSVVFDGVAVLVRVETGLAGANANGLTFGEEALELFLFLQEQCFREIEFGQVFALRQHDVAPRRDELADDDVLLEAEQVVGLAGDRAASVRTRVVSWKEAAARKLLVFSDALVTPRSTGTAVAGSPPSARTPWRCLVVLKAVDVLAGEHRCRRVVDDHLAHHLAHDDLDVLVVDVHTLVDL
jgi:hypothetical protein